jgi:ribosomal protein S18 acetylase RimI-like enzyme|tara:strand:- start:124 stop:564 length:441 start_codon:yes stop_codon:yes gene_type:complete
MSDNINIITPATEFEISKYYEIRFLELRKPWEQPLGSEKDSIEDKCVHRMMMYNDNYIGVGRLQDNGKEQAQIRYMAIKNEYQNQGFGKLLIFDLEKIAKERGAKEIILQSREIAVKFYQKLGYIIEKKTYLLFNDIQHFLMKKIL